MNDRRLLAIPGHAPALDDRGWGSGWAGPGSITVACTCGWRGLTVHERWFTPGENEAQSFAEPYRTFVATYGAEVMLSGDTDAYGTHEDAIRLYLAHIEYDPKTDHEQALAEVAAASDLLHRTMTAPSPDGEQRAKEAVKAGNATTASLAGLSAAIARRALWDSAPLLTPATPDPEGRRLIAEHQQARRTEDEARAAEPLSVEVRQALGLPTTD